MKNKMGLSYKKIYPLAKRTNLMESKLKRQLAAKWYIEHLYNGKNIINIDESTIRYSCRSQKAWSFKGQ